MTTDIHAAGRAIREALAAGPTPGPWLEKGRVNPSREAIRIESHHPADEHHLYQVCDVLDANGYPRNQANLQFIAACNPEAITTILSALEARDAEIAALREQVASLESRLEIDPKAPHIDGIYCRDETIRLQDEVIEGLKLDLHCARASVGHLSRLVDQFEVAAERYAYLRERDLDTIKDGGIFAGRTPHNVVLNGDDLDAAIDAARKDGV